jgi:hypothetical protein
MPVMNPTTPHDKKPGSRSGGSVGGKSLTERFRGFTVVR